MGILVVPPLGIPVPGVPILEQQIATAVAGFALQNGTPNILTWNVPNDGLNHRFIVVCTIVVTVAETGGAINVAFTPPGAGINSAQLTAGGSGIGSVNANYRAGIASPGTTVQVNQSSALTLGAASVFAEIWAS